MGVRVGKFIVKELGLEISEKILFSDSQCVLHWLKTRKPLSLFIENRVKEILNERDTTFRYIESAQNPADVGTRGSSVSEIGQSDLWWHGPTWLKNEDSLWPLWNLPDITPDVLDEINRETRIQHVLETTIVTGETSQQDSLLGSVIHYLENCFVYQCIY